MVGSGAGFELRRYPRANYVSIDVKSMSYWLAVKHGFHHLFHYISGANYDHDAVT